MKTNEKEALAIKYSQPSWFALQPLVKNLGLPFRETGQQSRIAERKKYSVILSHIPWFSVRQNTNLSLKKDKQTSLVCARWL